MKKGWLFEMAPKTATNKSLLNSATERGLYYDKTTAHNCKAVSRSEILIKII